MSRPRRPGLRPLAEINVTPLVDVMLVLLIVFMVTAALERQGVPVDLPEGKGNALATEDQPVTVTVDRDNQLFMDQTLVSRDQFAAQLPALEAAGTELIFRADKSVSYGTFVEVVALVRASGIERLTIETEPPAP